MKKANKSKKRSVILILFALALIAGTALFLLKPDRQPAAPEVTETEVPEVTVEEVDPAYITETCYDGSQEVNPILYSIPFDTGMGTYIQNKDLVNKISEDELLLLQEKASECAKLLFGTDSNTILADYENTETDLIRLFCQETAWLDEANEDTSVELYVADYLKALADNHYQAASKYETDKSLVWFNNCYYVRGLLQLDIKDCKDGSALSGYFPVEPAAGKSYQIVIDMGFSQDVINGIQEYTLTELDCKIITE